MKVSVYVCDLADNLHMCSISTARDKIACKTSCDVQSSGDFDRLEVVGTPLELHNWLNELKAGPAYRHRFIEFLCGVHKMFVLRLRPPEREYIDYKWLVWKQFMQ